jgi:hypothetical protein
VSVWEGTECECGRGGGGTCQRMRLEKKKPTLRTVSAETNVTEALGQSLQISSAQQTPATPPPTTI